ncbi:MAG: hypothetical protein IPI93_07870 [Sphingobacteriaceae bacterium]|nr:hypothetical protein [Sphingobacteriaceae bacterium]
MVKRTSLIAAGLLFSLTVWCQSWTLKLSSNVEIRNWKLNSTYEKEEKSLGGAKIVLTKAGAVIAETNTDSRGDFSVDVPSDGEFLLTVSYPGYNTKRFAINTKGVPEDISKDDWKPTFSIGGFIMAKPYPGIDYSGLEQPLVKVVYMPKKKLFNADEDATESGLNIVMKIYAAENALITKFCNTNKAGDAALAKPDCPLAKKLYQEAMAMIPFETYPPMQLAKVAECLKNANDAQAKAAEEAAKKAAAEKAAAEKALADAAAKAKADADAAAKAAADKAAAANKAAQEKEAAAKAKADEAAKAAAIEKAEKERKQKEGLAKSKAEDDAAIKAAEDKRKQKEKERLEAEAKAKQADLAEAKAKAEEKKEKERKQKEGMAKAKAEDDAEAKALADKREAERLAKEEEAKKSNNETGGSDKDPSVGHGNSKYHIPGVIGGADKYKSTIKRADELFKMKRWAEAKTSYEEALTYKKDDPYAISKLEIVNKNLAPK